MAMEEPPVRVETLAKAREQTLAAAAARIGYISDFTWEMPEFPRRRRGGLLRPVGKLMKAFRSPGEAAWVAGDKRPSGLRGVRKRVTRRT